MSRQKKAGHQEGLVTSTPENGTKYDTINGTEFPALVCGGLHYCCLWAFFQLYRSNDQIALRLGVSSKTAQRWRAKTKAGFHNCKGGQSCLVLRGALSKEATAGQPLTERKGPRRS